MPKPFIIIGLILIFITIAGCAGGPPDSDKDGFPDSQDQFPNDPKYHATKEEPYTAEETITEQQPIQYSVDSKVINHGIFDPDYEIKIIITNTDSESAIFKVKSTASDGWSDTREKRIGPHNTDTIFFYYDPHNEVNFRYEVYQPTKTVTKSVTVTKYRTVKY